ncbi:MAG: insulinase family protein [Oscillatoriales cyanobacterium C42_A2020_001]|nr:insulinase family protein [Leptolyngbyaceae cyanobacterium C42_A2020_001]
MTPFHRFRRFHFFTLLVTGFLTVILVAIAPAISQTLLPAFAAQLTQTPTQPTKTTPKPATLALTKGVEKTVLDNGLTVLTKQVDTAPVVSVQVWYRIGSRNEAPGVNGIAHQLEHLMFKGTKDRPIQFGRFFSALGSESNAFTSYDMTAYFGTVEQDKLEALLVLEADRMKNSIIDESALTSEKRVVISELQGYENSPSYRLGRAVMQSVFPDNPYGLPVGGTKADVEKFTVDQVRYYYDTYYRPDNAVLVVVGNFKPDETKKLIQDTFGKIPKVTKPLPSKAPISAPTKPTPRPASRSPIIMREPGSAALLNAVYPLPDVLHPDVPALQLMDYILSGGRSSRLYQALVETGLASDAGGYAANLIGGGWYDFSITAAPGKELKAIDAVLQQVVAELREKGITAEELARAKAQLRASITLRNRDISSQAIQLGDDFTSTGDYQFTDQLLSRITQVAAADIQRVARTYLTPANRTVGFFEPTAPNGKAGATPGNFAQTAEKFSPGAPVDPAEIAKYLPEIKSNSQQFSAQTLPEKLTLKNGMEVLLLRDRSTPTVTLSGFVAAGSIYDQPQTAGLASLTADNLLNGTKTQDALAIAKTLENRGADLQFGATREGVSISGEALAADLPTLVQVLADTLQHSNFPEKELELSRQQAITALKQDLDNPARVARRAFQQAVYPENHPFHVLPTEASLKAITRNDVLNFYKQQYSPESTILVLVGDFDPVGVRNLLTKEFGNWQVTDQSPNITFPTVPLPDHTVRLNPVLPGKTQSITFMGYNGIDRQDPRFYAVQVLNQILGGDTLSSRLGTEIRDRLGLTYGIYSLFQAGKTPGPFLVYMQTAPEDAERAISSTISLLQQVRQQGVTTAEVAAAKRSLTSVYSVELASPTDLASTILMNAVYGLGEREIRQYISKIEAVTPAQVSQAIQELLHPANLVIVTAGPSPSTSQK